MTHRRSGVRWGSLAWSMDPHTRSYSLMRARWRWHSAAHSSRVRSSRSMACAPAPIPDESLRIGVGWRVAGAAELDETSSHHLD